MTGTSTWITEISPNDEMFEGHHGHYFSVGRSAMFNIRSALTLAGTSPNRILDLPCGHGRVLRALRAEYGSAEITACDLLTDGVDFCAANFGAKPVYSREQCSEIPLTGSFDLIWCGSLLTHLEEPRVRDFLAFFAQRLAPGGVAVVTTHGTRTVQLYREGQRFLPETHDAVFERMIRDYGQTGFSYHPYPQSPAYGISLARPSWVIRQIEELPVRLLMAHEAGWDNHQDVFAFMRPR